MALLKTSTLKKITLAVLALALVSWVVVGVYRLKTSLAPSSTTLPPSAGLSSPAELEPLLKKTSSLNAVAGAFKGWQELKGSRDRYLFLGETVFSSNRQELIDSKIKVISESNNSTLLVVEKNDREETIGYLEDLTLEQVEKLIKPGDFIKVFFKKESDGLENFKDEEGNFLAEKILLQ